jgi:hypothetical protein
MEMNKLPAVETMLGLHSSGGSSPAEIVLNVQYQDPKGVIYELSIPQAEAMRLLANLLMFQKQYNLPVPPAGGGRPKM